MSPYEPYRRVLPVALATLPAIVGYVICSSISRSRARPHYVFWLVFLPVPLILLHTAFFPSQGASGDGAHLLALELAIPIVVAGVAVYLVCCAWRHPT